MKRFILAAIAALPLMFATPAFAQQSFPEAGRPITVIVPYPPGGGSDNTARALAPALEKELGVPIVIVNRPGAGSQIGMTHLAQSPADGHTIAYGLWPSTFTLYLDPSRKAPFDRSSFVTLAMHVIDPGTILVHADSPIRSFDDLVAAARAKPGAVTMGDPGVLGWEHIISVQIQKELGISFNQVRFQGAAPSVVALLGREVDAIMTSSSTAIARARAGQVRVLAVLSPEPNPFLPDAPTLASQGLSLTAGSARGFVAPAGTPEATVKRLASALETAITSSEHREHLKKLGLDATFMGPEEFSDYWTREEDAMRPVIDEIVREGQRN